MKEKLDINFASRMYSAEMNPDADAEPLSPVEQAKLDRLIFDLTVENQPAPAIEQQSDSVDYLGLAEHILEDLVPTLDKKYQEWVGNIAPDTIAKLLADIDAVRDDYKQEHQKELSDARVYHHYRQEYDSSTGDSQAGAYEALMIIDALMGGDIKNGRLPRVEDIN